MCSNYATEHSLSYNANKSYSLCFKATTIHFERPTLYFGQMRIPNITDCRYLGITISVKNCDLDLKRQKRRFYANANMLLRKFVKCLPDVKCYFFYKEDFIENQQKRRLTNTIYRTIYKIYIQSTTNFKIQTLNIIKKLLWSVNNKK